MHLSFQIDVASGATIVLVDEVFFVIALGVCELRRLHSAATTREPLVPMSAHDLLD